MVYLNEKRFHNGVICVCACLFNSAGLDWTEEAETYESSFYKRSLDSDLYIFTPTPFSKVKEQRENSSFYDQGSF